MFETDLEYYRRRMAQETDRQQRATTKEAASVHGALALIYAGEVRRLTPLVPDGAASAPTP